MQDCSNSFAIALELLQSCTKPSIYSFGQSFYCLSGSEATLKNTGTINWYQTKTQHNTAWTMCRLSYIDGLVQDCSNSSALAMELLQSCTKPSICAVYIQSEIYQLYPIFTVNVHEIWRGISIMIADFQMSLWPSLPRYCEYGWK